MRRLATLALLACAALAAAATPATAGLPSALPIPVRGDLLTQVGRDVGAGQADFQSRLRMNASGGYEVTVFTFGSAVFLDVVGPHHSETGYLARGVATPNRMQATFGNYGRVSMRFRESRSRIRPRRRHACKGKNRLVVRRGVFVGNLRFRGEGGYVSVHAHRAKGTVGTVAPRCQGASGGRGPGSQRSADGSPYFQLRIRSLAADWHEGVRSVDFLALGIRRRSLFLATTEESRGKLAIVRIALAKAGSPFRISNALTSASASPPAPFHGTGRYRAGPDGTRTWTGDLSVNFPGAPRFPLTGPQFRASIEVPF